jgi:hypothetical protein
MRITFELGSVRLLLGACAITGATLLVAVGCGGGSSSSGSPSGGSGGSGGSSGGDAGGDTATGGDTSTGGIDAGGTGGDTTMGEGGEAGEAPVLPPAKDHSAVSFVAGGAISTSKNFILIGNIGESLGGTKTTAKSLKHTFIPGVIAASSP